MTAKLHVENEIDCTPSQYWERIHGDDAFNRALYLDHLGHGYEQLVNDSEKGIFKAHIQPSPDAPALVLKVLGDAFSFVEDGVFDAQTRVYRFKITPSTLPNKIGTEGEMRVESVGDDRCRRVVDFTFHARIPGLGGVVEKFLAKTTKESFEVSAAFANQWLSR